MLVWPVMDQRLGIWVPGWPVVEQGISAGGVGLQSF